MANWFKKNDIKDQLRSLINLAQISGLNEKDINYSKEYLEYNETGLSFDTIITQLYEYDIEIDEETYLLIVDIGARLKYPIASYSFIQKLVKL